MSSTNKNFPITNEEWGAPKLEDAVSSQKGLRPKGTIKYRAGFSIDEILKPTFGVKMCPEIDSSQPLDMRTERNNTTKEKLINKRVYVGVHAGQCPFLSSSPDQGNNSSNSSRDSTPDSNHCSNSENSDSYINEKLHRELQPSFRDPLMFPQYTDALMSFEDLNFLTPTSYYNSLNRVYGLNISSMENHLLRHLGQIKLMNPLSGNSSLSSNFICSSIYSSANSSLMILTANNANEVTKSSQDGIQQATNGTLHSKPTYTSFKTLALKSSSTIYPGPERKRGYSAAGSGDRQTNVKSDGKCVSGDAEDGGCGGKGKDNFAWPAWVYCTRYSDRPSSGPRYRKPRTRSNNENDKRPRTAFSTQQLHRLRFEFETCPYLSETRRQSLALELGLNESQVKIWFQNKRAKLKKSTGSKNQLALRLMEQGLYNHSTIVVDDDGNKCDSRLDGSGDR